MITEQIPDTVKVAVSVSAPVLTVFGITVEDWTYILSALVSILFVIEKLPMFIIRIKALKEWMRDQLKTFKG